MNDLEKKRSEKEHQENFDRAFAKLSSGQARFFLMLNHVPRIAELWDIENRELKVESFEKALGVMSSGEIHIAKFFAAVWFHDNQRYGFDLIDAVSSIDSEHSKLIIEWISDPFWP